MHWAAQYIGKPWRLGATGPDEFDCWGLVCHVQRTHYGREMPPLAVYSSTPENMKSLHALLRRSPLKKTKDAPKDGDILVMYSCVGPHVGVALNIRGIVGILHAMGSQANPMTTIFTPQLEDLNALGFAKIQTYRFMQ